MVMDGIIDVHGRSWASAVKAMIDRELLNLGIDSGSIPEVHSEYCNARWEHLSIFGYGLGLS